MSVRAAIAVVLFLVVAGLIGLFLHHYMYLKADFSVLGLPRPMGFFSRAYLQSHTELIDDVITWKASVGPVLTE